MTFKNVWFGICAILHGYLISPTHTTKIKTYFHKGTITGQVGTPVLPIVWMMMAKQPWNSTSQQQHFQMILGSFLPWLGGDHRRSFLRQAVKDNSKKEQYL